MDTKKRKRKADEQPVDVGSLAKMTADFLKSATDEMQREYGDQGIACVGEAGRILVGISLPSLALEYLLQNTILPLSRVMQVVGTEGTFKSSLCFEINRWFRKQGGIGFLLENETKYSPDMASSIIGWDEPHALVHIPCNSVEDWQNKMQASIRKIRERMLGVGKEKGTGRTWPAFIYLDSLMGKLTEDSIKKIEDTGFSERSFPAEAMLITTFLKKIPSDISQLPIFVAVTNHLKPRKDERGLPVRGKAGGAQISFQESIELEIRKAHNHKIILAANEKRGLPRRGGSRLNIACFKNCFGETFRNVDVDILWWREELEDGTRRQITRWDWHGATVKFLLGLEGGVKRRVDEIIDLNRVQKQGQPLEVWSDRLGIPQKDPIDPTAAGEMIAVNLPVMEALRKEFDIEDRKRFVPGVDYLEQLAMVKEELRLDV